MKRSLVQWLRCPETGKALRLLDAVTNKDGEVVSGRLVAEAGREYPIIDGVPVMLPADGWVPGQLETRESFSEKWRKASNYREASRDQTEDTLDSRVSSNKPN